MIPGPRKLAVLCLAAGQLFIGLASAQGFVLCVGSGDHRAVEFAHSDSRCLDPGQPAESAPMPLEAGSSGSCDDTPLMGAGTEISSAIVRDAAPTPTLIAVLPCVLPEFAPFALDVHRSGSYTATDLAKGSPGTTVLRV